MRTSVVDEREPTPPLGLHLRGQREEVFRTLVGVGKEERRSADEESRGDAVEASAGDTKLLRTPDHQRGERRIEQQDPEH